MSTARLNVWVTKVGDPCTIDDTRQWFVHVLHCDGRILRWCDRDYRNIPTKCGEAEIELPPGCYQVVATWSPAPNTGNVPTTLGNHISHLQIVRVNCGDHACVTLFPPTFHYCGIWWLVAARQNLELGGLPQEEAEIAIRAVERLLDKVEDDPFTLAMLDDIDRHRPDPDDYDQKQRSGKG